MDELQQAIKKLKERISLEYWGDTPNKKSLFALLDETADILDKVNSLSLSDAALAQLVFLESSASKLVNDCSKALTDRDDAFFTASFLRLREVVLSAYFYVSQRGLRGEIKAQLLALDIKDLASKKQLLEDQLQDLEQIIEMRDEINGQSVNAAVALHDILNHKNEIEQISSEIKSNLSSTSNNKEISKNLVEDVVRRVDIFNEMFDSVNDIKIKEIDILDELEHLNSQSKESSEEIKKILGDVNRESMAGSFKERKEELTKSVWIYDGVNYAALAIIAGIAMYAFTHDTEFSLKLIYERLLMALPFAFISWFASRRSQYLFQLKEDYAYKYSSAMAFEGYKRQAEMNEEMHNELLKIAITNLGKTPTSIFDRDLKHTPTDKIIDTVKEVIPKIK